MGTEGLLAERYRLDHVVGHGGMAVVYVATDTVLGRRVAIKYFQTHLMHDAVLVERFRREALAAAKIDHPNVVAIHDIGEGEDGRPFIVMEYVDGPSLATLLKAGPLEAERAATLAAGIAKGLGAAHALGFVHRDVKPANVIVAEGELAKLTDFGLVRAADEFELELTAPGSLVGSAHYVAPEQARHGDSSPASDLYALGITLYQMLAGETPFSGTSAIDVAIRRLEEPPPPLLERVPHADRELAAIVASLLVRNPEQREADASALGEELEQIATRLRETRLAAEAPTIHGAPLPPGRPRRRRDAGIDWSTQAARARALIAAAVLAGRRRVRSELLGPRRRDMLIGLTAVAAVLLLIVIVAAGGGARREGPSARATAPPPRATAHPAPAYATVPDVRGRAGIPAARSLIAQHWKITVILMSSDQPPGTILAQKPAPGTRVPPGSEIRLDVAADRGD